MLQNIPIVFREKSVSTEFHYNSKNNTFTGQSNHRLTTEMTVDSLNRPDMKKLMVENCTIQQEYSYIQNQTTLQTYPLVACLKTRVNDGGFNICTMNMIQKVT